MKNYHAMDIDTAREIIFKIALDNANQLTARELTAFSMAIDALDTIKDMSASVKVIK